MRRFAGRPRVSVVSGLVLLMAACGPEWCPESRARAGKGGLAARPAVAASRAPVA